MNNSSSPVLSVSALNGLARQAIETSLRLLWVHGEISNMTRAASGHWYFSLKDAQAQVRCTMFRGRNQFADFLPANGDQVEIRAVPTLYEARGEFQLQVEVIRRAGLGVLFEAFEKLKARLSAEGLFDPGRKRSLPVFPRSIGIVTSTEAAALRDVLTTLHRRAAWLPVVIYPTPVQGQGAGTRIAGAIRLASERRECDVLLICRGGGSIEDLWAFNDEAVARAIADSAIPVISGVGHETDFTIADFVADLRAPTPTAAAEQVSLSQPEWMQGLSLQHHRIARAHQRILDTHAQRLDLAARRLVHPAQRLQNQRETLARAARGLYMTQIHVLERARLRFEAMRKRLDHARPDPAQDRLAVLQTAQDLRTGMARILEQQRSRLDSLALQLHHLNPESVLARGYSVVQDENGRVVYGSAQIASGDKLSLRFHQGRATAEVLDKET